MRSRILALITTLSVLGSLQASVAIAAAVQPPGSSGLSATVRPPKPTPPQRPMTLEQRRDQIDAGLAPAGMPTLRRPKVDGRPLATAAQAASADGSVWGVPVNAVIAGPSGPVSWLLNSYPYQQSWNTGTVAPGEALTATATIYNSDNSGFNPATGKYNPRPHPVAVTWRVSCNGIATDYDLGQTVTAPSNYSGDPNIADPLVLGPDVSLDFQLDPQKCALGIDVLPNVNFSVTVIATVLDSAGPTTTGRLSLSAYALPGRIPADQSYGCGQVPSWSGFCPPQVMRGDPVNTATGAFTESVTDVAVPGAGVPFALTRGYASNNSAVGPLGRGWTLAWSAALTIAGNGDATFVADDGSRYVYVRNPDGSFTGPVTTRSRLVRAGANYLLTTPDHRTLTFDGDGALLAARDRSGTGVSLGYAGGRLASVTDAAGRTATLSYTSDHLTRVDLADGRSMSYGYSSDLLTSVTGVDGAVTRYGYDAAQRLTSVIDPLGHAVTTLQYDGQGRVTSQTDAAGAVTRFAYRTVGPADQTDVTAPAGGVWSELYTAGVLLATFDPFGNETRYRYDGSLNPISVTDPANRVTRYEYDSVGRLTRETSPVGSTRSWTYDPAGNVATAVDGNGRTTTYGYGAAGRLTSVQDPAGGVTSFGYTATGQLATVTDPLGAATTYAYDGSGNQIAATTPLGERTTRTFDPAGSMLTETDPRGNEAGADPADYTTTHTYDPAKRIKTVRDPVGNLTRYDYDPAGNLVAETDPVGAVTEYGYDVASRLSSTTDPAGGTTAFGYDPDGNRVSATDPLGARTTFAYDLADRLVATTTPRGNVAGADPAAFTWTYGYNDVGDQTSITDPTGATTRRSYDAAHRLITVTNPLGHIARLSYDGNGNVLTQRDYRGKTTTFGYDVLDRLASITDPLGKTGSYGYDAAGNLTAQVSPLGSRTTYGYDAVGRRVSAVDPRGNVAGSNPADYRWTFGYDAAGNPTSVTDPLGHTTTASYDRAGRLTAGTDQVGRTVGYTFDPAGRLTTVTAPDGGTTVYGYDLRGLPLTRRDANGHLSSFGYDSVGRLVSVADPLGRTTLYGYDPDGRLATVVDPRGITTTNSYDGRRLLTGVGYSDGTPAVSYGYDAAGLVSSITDGTGSHALSHDAQGNLLSYSVPGQAQPFTYAYDANGAVTSRTYPSGLRTTYSYDPDGRPVGQTTGFATTSFGYDAAGNLTSVGLPASTGYTEHRAFDRAGRLTRVHAVRAGSVREDRQLTLDAAGQPTAVSVVRAGVASPPMYFGYDVAGRLTSECVSAVGTTGCPAGSSLTSYAYDQVGNRLSRSSSLGSLTLYSYDAADQLVAAVTDGSTVSYGYDAAGNQTSAGSLGFGYEAAGRLVSAAGGGDSYTYSYDGFGNRVGATRNGSLVRTTLWDPNGPLAQPATDIVGGVGGPATDYTHDPLGRPLALRSAGAYSYQLHDWLGSVTGMVSSAGVAQTSAVFDAFGTGSPTNLVPSPPASPFGFTGQYRETLGPDLTYNLRARTYDPSLGRFLSVDPVAAPRSMPYGSAYAYALDSPTVFVDPSGRCPWCIGGIIGGIVGGASYALGHEGEWSWSGFGKAVGGGALIGIGGGLLMPAAGAGAVSVLGLRAGSFAAGVTSFGVNATVGAGYSWAVNTVQCRPTGPADLLLGALGGGLSQPFVGLVGRGSLAGLSIPVAASAGRGRTFTFGDLPDNVLGSTDELGNITIQRGLSGDAFWETLRHETVHSILTPRPPFNRLTIGLYGRSGLYRYAEEALAESYATHNLIRGLAFPITEGYVSVVRLGTEVVVVGGVTYGGYRFAS